MTITNEKEISDLEFEPKALLKALPFLKLKMYDDLRQQIENSTQPISFYKFVILMNNDYVNKQTQLNKEMIELLRR